jgi:uncharacterized Zn finger protein
MAIPAFQIEEIEQLVGRRYFRQGMEYARSGAVVEMHRQGTLLSAACVGSSRTPYQVEAKFDDKGLVESHCTCPVGDAGQCKHVAALLIAWVEAPQSFVEIEPWETALGRFQRRELIELILQLMERRPELERVIETILPKGEAVPMAASSEDCDRQVADLLARAGTGPDANDELATQLLTIKETGDQFSKQHESTTAAAVYQALIHGLLQNPERLDHRQSELVDLVYECVEGLSVCLFHLSDQPEARQPILRTLLDLYRFDVMWGGVSLAVDLSRMILAHVNKDERNLVADWVRATLPSISSPAARRTFGGFLLELLGRQVEESELFDVCRRTDRIFDLVRRLLLTDRLEEALEEAPKADDAELLKIADLLVRFRGRDAAQRLVEQRAAKSSDPRLKEWLDAAQTRHEACRSMVELSEQLFRMQPDFAAYQRIRGLARQVGTWDTLRPELLHFIEESGNRALLVRIHLEENNIDRAMEVVLNGEAGVEDDGLAGRVAKAAESSRPIEAMQLYQAIAERLISRRGRENYAEAGRYLRKIRKLMRRTGNIRDWQTYLEDLRRRYRPVQALYEELEATSPGDEV